MKRSLLTYSAWISLVCFTCFSCSLSRILVSGDESGKIINSLVSGSFEKINLKAKVTFHENEISGLMLIKKTDDGSYKLAFYNELGMTYLEGIFDNSSKNKKLIIKNISPAFDHKAFIKSFEKCLQTFFTDKTIIPVPFSEQNTIQISLHNGFILDLKTND